LRPEEVEPAAAVAVVRPVAEASPRGESTTVPELPSTAPERPAASARSLSEAIQIPPEPVAIPISTEGPAAPAPARSSGTAAPDAASRPRPSRFVPTTLQNQPVSVAPSPPSVGNGTSATTDLDGATDGSAVAEVATPPPRERSRVPVDAHAPTWIEPQVRPVNRPIRTKGSGEWKDRQSSFPTTRRRAVRAIPPIAVGFVVLVAVGAMLFLLPTFLAGGGPVASESPGPSSSITARGTRGPAATTRPRPRGTPRFYTVKPGDTLLRIARRFRVSKEAIACASQLQNPNVLHPGEILTIPPRGYECPRRPARRQNR
jgi:nucleoid-associated protein YgaU